MTQADRVLAVMNMTGSVDVRDFPAGFRLAARIKDLRDAGHAITTERRTLPGGATIAVYHLESPHPKPTTGIQTALALR